MSTGDSNAQREQERENEQLRKKTNGEKANRIIRDKKIEGENRPAE